MGRLRPTRNSAGKGKCEREHECEQATEGQPSYDQTERRKTTQRAGGRMEGRIRYVDEGANKRRIPLVQSIGGGQGVCGEDDEEGSSMDRCRTTAPRPQVGQRGTGPYGPGPDPAFLHPDTRGGGTIPYCNRVKPANWGRAREGSSLPTFEARRSMRRTAQAGATVEVAR